MGRGIVIDSCFAILGSKLGSTINEKLVRKVIKKMMETNMEGRWVKKWKVEAGLQPKGWWVSSSVDKL